MLRLCARVAPAQTLPRGERDPRLGRRICRPEPVTQSDPAAARDGLRRGFLFSKNKSLGSASRALASECKRDDRPGAAFCAGAFLMAFFSGIPCSAYTQQYPIPARWLLGPVHHREIGNEFEK